MKLKKIISALTAVFVTAGAFSFTSDIRPFSWSTAYADDYTEVSILGITYYKYSDHLEVVDGSSASGTVTVPLKYGQLPITAIADGAFSGSDITSVILQKGIASIGDRAFMNCKTLTSVVLPETLVSIGSSAFAGCPMITDITIPQSTGSVGENAFADDEALESFTVYNFSCVIEGSGSTVSNIAGEEASFNGIVYGYDDSTAQIYAQTYGYTFVSLGAAPESGTTASTSLTTTTTTSASTTTTTSASTTTTTSASTTTTTSASTTTTTSASTTTTTSASTTTTTSASTTTTTSASTTTTTSASTTTTTSASTTATTTTTEVVQGKPIFILSHVEVTQRQAVKSPSITITLSVKGAEGLYCNTGIYLYYDERLAIDSQNPPESGAAISALSKTFAYGDTGDFIFLTTCADGNYGKDGVMWNITFTLPENAQAGDEYEFRIGGPKYAKSAPLFSNYADDEDGIAMQDYIFTSGLAEGYIRVTENPAFLLGDVDMNGVVDGIDASAILSEYANLSTGGSGNFDDEQNKAADADGNGIVDGIDASMVLSYYAYSSTGGKLTLEDFIAERKSD